MNMTTESESELALLKKRILDLQIENKHLRKALEFYADKRSWYPGDSFKQSCRIDENDLEYFPIKHTSDLIGGKLARLHLKDLEGIHLQNKK
jgi:hypothetical protein